MTSVPNRERILEVAKRLWTHREGIDIDTVDGTFYWGVCRYGDIEELRLHKCDESCTHSPMFTGWVLNSLVPGSKTLEFDWSFIPMRPATFNTSIRLGGSIDGEAKVTFEDETIPSHRTSFVVGEIRHADWTGERVEEALWAWAGKNYTPGEHDTEPELTDSEARQVVGLRLYRDQEYAEELLWDPSRDNPNSFDQGLVLAEAQRYLNSAMPGEERLNAVVADIIRELPHERVPYSPFIRLTTTLPLPPRGVIAAYYNGIARDRGWSKKLRGAVDRQDIDVAIVTWAATLLQLLGAKRWHAIQDAAEAVGREPVSETTFDASRNTLRKRVPELKDFERIVKRDNK